MNVGLQVHNTIDEPEYLKPLQNYMSLITGHRSENYKNLKVESAVNWYILYWGHYIVGFAGIQIPHHWEPYKIARIMYRTYLAPEVRGKGMTKTAHNWYYSGDLMIRWCMNNNYTPVITRDNDNCKHLLKTAKTTKTGLHASILDGYYWTCPHEPDDNPLCWQKVLCFGNSKPVEEISSKYMKWGQKHHK